MAGLLDLGPLTEEVKVGAKSLTVSGLSAEDLFYLLNRFPDIRKLLNRENVTTESLVALAPNVIDEIIVCACGSRKVSDGHHANNHAMALKTAHSLPAGVQADILSAVVRLTFPGGVGPFAERLAEFASTVTMTPKEVLIGKSDAQSGELVTDWVG